MVVGIDNSNVMVNQARKRNAAGIRAGKVNLVHGTATGLPFADGSFTKALSVNSLHLWPDAVAGLREMRRVLKPGGTVAITFTPASGQSGDNLVNHLLEAGFREARLEKGALRVTALANRERLPSPNQH